MYSSTRSQWGAKGNGGSNLPPPRSEVVVHTEAGPDMPPTSTRAQEMARMRAIDAFHLTLGWKGGFGYSAGMNPRSEAGRVHEGRGYLKSGAHTQGRNNQHAIVLFGNGDRHPMTAGAIRGCRRWIGEGVARGAMTMRPKVSGHRDYASKSCPGNRIYPQLGQLRGVTALDRHDPVTPPTPPPTRYTLGDRILRFTDPYMAGPDIAEWQILLAQWRTLVGGGPEPVKVDGAFGRLTRNESARFMRREMDVETDDPRVGPKTIAAMRTWLANPPTRPTPPEEEDELAHLSEEAQRFYQRQYEEYQKLTDEGDGMGGEVRPTTLPALVRTYRRLRHRRGGGGPADIADSIRIE